MGRTVATGIQDFSKIREKDLFYVDKTNFIKEWWESNDEVTLITRPRRFGKTLTMSMVEQFFSVGYAGRGELFEGLDIWKEEKCRELQGTYPVVSLSFSNIKESSYLCTHTRICELIAEEYNKYFFLLDGSCLTQPEKNIFNRIANNEMRGGDAVSSLNYLSKFLSRYYGKRVIILLDEYDTPMQEAFVNGYWDELAGFTRSLFSSTFKTNPFLERGLMTGITRISKESIFSGLNNLKVITVTSRKYETAFGFTEQEVFHALEEYGLESKRDGVKEWYDGFRFGDCDSIYNPWSVTEFLDAGELAEYWVNTSSNRLIEKLIREGSPEIKIVMEDLLAGKDFSTAIDEQVVFDQLDDNEGAIWSLLLASGYLKFRGFRINRKQKREYVLALTNLEVRMMFNNMFTGWISRGGSPRGDFSDALLSGDKERMQSLIEQTADRTFSYYDTGTKPSEFKQPENFYHGFVLGLTVDLSKIYSMKSNRESGLGRYDVVLEPKNGSKDDGIILEFKVYDPDKEKALQDTVRSALNQIIEKRYAADLESKGVFSGKIRIYGFAFRGKEVLIDGGYLSEFVSNSEPAGSAGEASAGKLTAF